MVSTGPPGRHTLTQCGTHEGVGPHWGSARRIPPSAKGTNRCCRRRGSRSFDAAEGDANLDPWYVDVKGQFVKGAEWEVGKGEGEARGDNGDHAWAAGERGCFFPEMRP